MFKGYKGVKITKRLDRYIGYAKSRYAKMSLYEEVDLWEILNQYELIMQQPKHVQMYIYDLICDKFVHFGEYSVVREVDGGMYVKKLKIELIDKYRIK